MNTKRLLLALSVALPLSALAGEAEPIASTRVSCASPNWPNSVEIARYLQPPHVLVGGDERLAHEGVSHKPDAQAMAQAESVRQYIRKEGRNECWRGVTYVRVDFYPSEGEQVAVAVRGADDPT